MTKRIRRAQNPKPNRHVRVQELRRSNAAQPHKIHKDPRDVRKYGIRAIVKGDNW